MGIIKKVVSALTGREYSPEESCRWADNIGEEVDASETHDSWLKTHKRSLGVGVMPEKPWPR